MLHIQGSEYVRNITNIPFFNTTRNIDKHGDKHVLKLVSSRLMSKYRAMWVFSDII